MRGATRSRLGDLGILIPTLLLAFLNGYSIYRTPTYFVVVGAGLAAGTAIAFAAHSRNWSLKQTALTTLGAYVVLGILLAAPSIYSDPSTIYSRALAVLLAPVAGPRQILSLTIPLGDYQAVLGFFLFLALLVTTTAFACAWGPGNVWRWVPVMVVLPLLAGIVLGPDSIGAVGDAFPPGLPSGHGAAGLLVVLLLFGWVGWKGAVRAGGSIQPSGEDRRRRLLLRGGKIALGCIMVTTAVSASAVLTPALMSGTDRSVLRTDIPMELRHANPVSPLSSYRKYFEDNLFNVPLFRVSADPELERVRIATMDHYDGTEFKVSVPNADEGACKGAGCGEFARVPSYIETEMGSEGTRTHRWTAQVTIEAFPGPWVPLVGELGTIRFEGPHRAELQDGLFYNRETGNAVQVGAAGMPPGTTYGLEVYDHVVPEVAVASFMPARQGTALNAGITPTISAWLSAQELPPTGPGLLDLVDRLRTGGYLSHALVLPSGATPAWINALPGYEFQPSRAGHSQDRIDALLSRLEQQGQRSEVSSADVSVSGATGDDEQFSVAAALIADALGFNARVVLGARLKANHAGGDLTHCVAEVCRGKDMSVWVEVQDGETGPWAAIDVTPQHEAPPVVTETVTTEPKHPTRVQPMAAKELPPPVAKPSGSPGKMESSQVSAEKSDPFRRIFYAGGLAILGASVLLTLPLTVLAAKRVRLRRRKGAPTGASRVLGAWQEYLDRTASYGYQVRSGATRMEVAHMLSISTSSAVRLAELADRSRFDLPTSSTHNAEDAWSLYLLAIDDLQLGTTWLRRVRARFSPRSLFAAHRTGRTRKRLVVQEDQGET